GGQHIILAFGADLGSAVFRVGQPVFLQPEQQWIDRALCDLAEAVVFELLGDLVAVGRLAADDRHDAALQRALEHLRWDQSAALLFFRYLAMQCSNYIVLQSSGSVNEN